jgi:hypothetical protein
MPTKTKPAKKKSAKRGRPKKFTAQEQGRKKREQELERSRQRTVAVSDIGDLPPIRNKRRREACRLDARRFLETYFPNTTGLSPFSPDHHRVIARFERCVLRGGRFVNAVFRGFGKTTVGENLALWALLYGHRRFVVFFGADAPAAESSIDSLQTELAENDLLHDDFPEVCHPIRALDGKPQRCGGQHFHGKRTFIEWTSDRIVFPTIEGSAASSAVVCVRGITAGFRGLKKKLPDGGSHGPTSSSATTCRRTKRPARRAR